MYHLKKKIILQQQNNTPVITLHLDLKIQRTNITRVVNFTLKVVVVATTPCNRVIPEVLVYLACSSHTKRDTEQVKNSNYYGICSGLSFSF